MKRPKIAFLIPGFGVIERGAENFVYELAKRLSRNYEITIYGRGYKEYATENHIRQVKVTCISRDNRFLNWLYLLHPQTRFLFDTFQLSPQGIEMLTFTFAVACQLLIVKYDLLFPVSGFWGALFCKLMRILRGTPFIYSAHGGEEPLIARLKPDMYVGTTPFTYQWLKQFDAHLRTTYIPNGVDTQKFYPGKKLNLKLERPIFLTVGMCIDSKRLDLAINAVAKLKNGSLILIGSGPLYQKLWELGEKLLGKKRFMITNVKFPLLRDYYRTCDVFTLPSDRDPSPLVFLEAAACNRPLVATDDPRRIETLKNAALYCDVTNSKDYARTLEKAALKKWGDVPRKLALDYNWGKIAQKYQNSIKQFLNEKKKFV